MIKLVEWLLGQKPAPHEDPRLSLLEAQWEEVENHRAEARELRITAERIGPEQRWRLAQNHFGDGMREALHQRGWTQT